MEAQVLDNLNILVSVDPGIKNLGVAVLELAQGSIVLSGTFDLGWKGRTESGRELMEISKEVFRVLTSIKNAVVKCYPKNQVRCKVALVERQSQGAPFEQLEGILAAALTVIFSPERMVPIFPRAVARWIPEKFKGKRCAKKKWTHQAVCHHFKIEQNKVSVDECDALLNFLYFSKIPIEILRT